MSTVARQTMKAAAHRLVRFEAVRAYTFEPAPRGDAVFSWHDGEWHRLRSRPTRRAGVTLVGKR